MLLATLLRGYANDVYFQVGLITIIGLSAKNAILIIEFAKDLQAQGKSVVEAALAAAHMRFRPILMTGMAFMLGVLPLAIAVFFVPIFFVLVRGIFKGSERQRQFDVQHAHQIGVDSHE